MSNQRVIFIRVIDQDYRTIYEVPYHSLKGMSVIEDGAVAYLEMCVETDDREKIFPRFKFEGKDAAKSLENKIRYAKADYDETRYSLHFFVDDDDA